MKILKYISGSLNELVFPVTCACCGIKTEEIHQTICNWCRRSRFEDAGEDQSEILPETVSSLYSMWYFDKGGYLQQLLHNLKYNHLKGVGRELGRILAASYMRANESEKILQMSPVIVPVPIHKTRLRRRGYNQARVLAEGFCELTNWELIEEKAIIRVKNTVTQTGLTSRRRSENIRGAFSVQQSEILQGRIILILDDVFTTGATTFELARILNSFSNQKAEITTVARA